MHRLSDWCFDMETFGGKLSTQNTETPWILIHEIEREFGIKFKYDMAGNEANKKAPFVFTESQDSLSMDWPTDGWCWLNPTFKNLTKWTGKVFLEKKKGAEICTIWPLSGDRNQILSYTNSEVNIIHGRIWGLVRGVMICRWSKSITPLIKGYDWDKKTLSRVW
jgi:hypothetical protein